MESIVNFHFPRRWSAIPNSQIWPSGDKLRPFTEPEILAAERNLKAKTTRAHPKERSHASVVNAPKGDRHFFKKCLSEVTCEEAHDTTTPSVRLSICLLDTIGKVFDKGIAARLDEAIATAKKVPSKPVRIPERIVTNTSERAIAGSRRKGHTKKYCLVLTLDIRNAFKTTDWAGTLVVLESTLGSREIEVTAGVRQGVGRRGRIIKHIGQGCRSMAGVGLSKNGFSPNIEQEARGNNTHPRWGHHRRPRSHDRHAPFVPRAPRVRPQKGQRASGSQGALPTKEKNKKSMISTTCYGPLPSTELSHVVRPQRRSRTKSRMPLPEI
ncbi:uncharacterized protein LOC117136490 isoform X1 [Drosophila mauritiana]|uniref:Uncharacterized protein LOC117136490 isoform X1 n=1 Tax=Drosophila mauritiana TaxID=7226 RepID=A0A6P8JKF6_DROMA|nr:uncharacterized protein LOC117136490 isoform X1 [Drosophila mauritiana]